MSNWTNCICAYYLHSVQPGDVQDHDRYAWRILYVKVVEIHTCLSPPSILFHSRSWRAVYGWCGFKPQPSSPAAGLVASTRCWSLTWLSVEGLHRQDGLQRVQGALHSPERLEAELHDVWPGQEWDRWTKWDDPGHQLHGWELEQFSIMAA